MVNGLEYKKMGGGKLPFVINLLVLIIVFVIVFLIAYFLGRKFKRLILKENDLIGIICSIGIIITFFIIKEFFLSSDKSFRDAVSFGVMYGLAFGIGNRGRQKNN